MDVYRRGASIVRDDSCTAKSATEASNILDSLYEIRASVVVYIGRPLFRRMKGDETLVEVVKEVTMQRLRQLQFANDFRQIGATQLPDY